MSRIYAISYYLWGLNTALLGVGWYITGNENVGLCSLGSLIITLVYWNAWKRWQ